MQVFLTRAAITDEPDLEGRTALMWAASKAADEVIATWVRHNPDLQQTDKNGGTGMSLRTYYYGNFYYTV